MTIFRILAVGVFAILISLKVPAQEPEFDEISGLVRPETGNWCELIALPAIPPSWLRSSEEAPSNGWH